MKKIIMISNEFYPYKIYGGLGIATRRLADQLINCGNLVTILFPLNYNFAKSIDNLEIKSFFMEDINYKLSNYEIANYFAVISKKILSEIAKLDIPKESIFIVHDNEMALTVKLIKKFRPDCKIIFWLHSLYDYPKRFFFNEKYKKLFSCESLLASAIDNSDLTITSSGVIKDSKTTEWPEVINEIKKSLIKAKNDNKILEVESFGCLPKKQENKKNLKTKKENKDYFLFPSRPSFSKGIGFFGELSNYYKNDYDFFAIGPIPKEILSLYPAIKEINWLSQRQLFLLMKSAKGVILPSITEGYGLSAAESILLSATTIYHDIGGHNILKNYPNSFCPVLTKEQKEKLYLFWGELLEEKQEPIKIWLKSKSNFNDLFEWWEKIIITLPNSDKESKTIKNNKTWGELITEEIKIRRW